MAIEILKPLYSPENPEPRHQKKLGAHARGYTRKWENYRLRFLAKHPFCEMCLAAGTGWPGCKQYVVATVVDHIQPHKGDMKLFWQASNHRALCKPCHDRFGAK